jgi:desulfoferrodoxin (superoxide reductase-like protein)
MMTRRKLLFILTMLPFYPLYARPAFANKSSTAIEAPPNALKGSEVTLRVTVTHRGNNFLHYTNWLRVIANQQEIARWDFSSGRRPEAAVFTREVKINALEDLEVTAEANCNIHGSAGPVTVNIPVRE